MRGRHRFAIPFLQYLDTHGEVDVPLPAWTSDIERLQKLYEQMVLARTLDQKAVALQRTGQLGTYPSTLGQEAVGVAIGLAMQADDVLVPYYRDAIAQILRGMPPENILLFWGGEERGSDPGGASQDFPPCVPVATQLSHAAGVATAMKLRNESRVTLVTCGDGATSKGDFMESLNLAGVWQLPLVVVINNNQWAISVPLKQQTAAQSLAQKAIAAGIDGTQVDGNDVIAVYDAVKTALDKARKLRQPSLIEAVSYRLSDHTTADDASRYRDQKELNVHWAEEPIGRFQHFLHTRGYWDEAREKALQAHCRETVDAVVAAYLAAEAENPEAIIDYLYAFLPAALEEQREAIGRKAEVLNGQENPGA